MINKFTHHDFIEKLKISNNSYINGEFNILGTYVNSRTKILVENKYGKCLVRPSQLFKGYGIRSSSAINRSKYFVNQAIEVHGNRYTYKDCKVVNTKQKVIIGCLIHGNFEIEPRSHLSGCGCKKCGIKVSSKNSSWWKLSDWKKAGEHSKHFDSFKVYIIRCWNEEEEFYKIGRTFTTIKKRFNSKAEIPYDYEVIKVFEDTAKYCFDLENRLKRENKTEKYKPLISFNGNTECFSKINLHK